MYYTIRPTGPRTKRELIGYYLSMSLQIVKWLFSLGLLALVAVASVTRNYGALAVLGLTSLFLGAFFNFLNQKRWVPGLGRGSWFTRTVALSLYIFLAFTILLIANPSQP